MPTSTAVTTRTKSRLPRATSPQPLSVISACCTPSGSAVADSSTVELASLFKALADPARVTILSMLLNADEVCAWLVRETASDRSYGARPLRRAIQRHIEDSLSEALIEGRFQDRGRIEVFMDGEVLGFRTAVETSA